MMISATTVDALNRISARAQDVLRAYSAGGLAANNDVNLARSAPLYSADPLSVAAPAGAFFVTQRSDGTRTFTRDGGFSLDAGTLRGADGSAVLGYAAGEARGTLPAPIVLPVRDVALGRCADVRIESDGTVAYSRTSIDPRTTERTIERVVAGKIALARFPAGTQPVRIDDAHVAAPQGIPPHLGTPADGTFAGVAMYSRDTGAVDIDTSLVKLAEAYRSFSALHAATTARGGVERTAMDLLK
jgi:flagellar basal body rod protein FlgG